MPKRCYILYSIVIRICNQTNTYGRVVVRESGVIIVRYCYFLRRLLSKCTDVVNNDNFGVVKYFSTTVCNLNSSIDTFVVK